MTECLCITRSIPSELNGIIGCVWYLECIIQLFTTSLFFDSNYVFVESAIVYSRRTSTVVGTSNTAFQGHAWSPQKLEFTSCSWGWLPLS